MLERADARLNASPPALAAAEPTLLLVSRSLLGQPAAPRQDYPLDSHFLSESFIGRAPKTAICCRQVRRLIKNLLVPFQCRLPLLLIGHVIESYVVMADNAVFHFVNPHRPAKLVGLVGFAFADEHGVRVDQARDFVGGRG